MVQSSDSMHDMQWQKGQQDFETVGLEAQEDPMREFLGNSALVLRVQTYFAAQLPWVPLPDTCLVCCKS